MYDELHSYRATTPAGWCCDSQLKCSRLGQPRGSEAIQIRHSYLEAGDTIESAIANDLRESAGVAKQVAPIITAIGRQADTWRIQRADGGVELVAYFLEENVYLVRLSLSSASASAPKAESDFQLFVKSYTATPALPNTSLERTRER